jgi:deazaflavin-dependent oxidoreductase (nitroreductase family)
VGLLTPLAIRIGGLPWVPKLLPQIVWVDKHLQSLTRGRTSLLDIGGLPNLVLTVTGRKTGLARSTPLLCVPHQGALLIAGSNFGGPKEPVWVKNIEANPAVSVRFDGQTRELVSTQLEGEARAGAWLAMLEVWPNFAKYEQRTSRQIKVFALQPPA